MFVDMTQNEPVFGAKADPKMLADALGFGADEIDSRYAPQMVSTGSNFLIVPLESVLTLASSPWAIHCRPSSAPQLPWRHLLRRDQRSPDRNPPVGRHQEDPATGSAVGCAAAFLIQNGIRKPEERIAIRQGRFVNRPSILYVRAGMANGKATHVRVGGYVVDAMRGRFTI